MSYFDWSAAAERVAADHVCSPFGIIRRQRPGDQFGLMSKTYHGCTGDVPYCLIGIVVIDAEVLRHEPITCNAAFFITWHHG
jgi:hypothetical protein